MKKIMSLLLVGLFLTSALIPLFFTGASSAQSADEITADRNRRTLFHLIACLNRDTTFDLGDDELTSADDIFAENDGTFAVEQVVEVVGLDVLRGSGVMTCLEAMRYGINLLRPGSVSSSSLNEMGNYFIEDAYGTSFATSSASIPLDNRFSSNIATIVAEAEAQMAVYESQISAQSALLILRNRTVGLIDICFEMVGPNNGRGQNGLVFERPGVGFFYEQNRSQVVGTEGNWLPFMNVGGRSSKIFSGFNLTPLGERDRDLFTADINTGYEVSGQNTTRTWDNGVNFFPVGRDTPQTNGYDNGLVDCEFVQDFADIIFNGISVSPEGVLVNPDGTPLTGALADAVADVQTSTGDVEGDNCETRADFAFGFVLCPLLEITDRALGWLDNRIVDALNVNEAYYENEDIRNSWENVRDIAFLLLVPAALIMVIGTALQLSFVDPYTVKRALPRLFVAIIFIAISFEVSAIAIELTNAVGRGIAGVVTSPFGGLANLRLADIFNPSGADNLFATGGALVGIGVAFLSGVTVWTLFSFIGVAALALLIIFILLSVRELLIVFLIVISPIAIITWIFPGNDKGWKLWWGTFSKMLLIYPIIMGFLGVGRAFASIVGEAGGDPVVSTIVKLVAFIGPYFFIPKAFQMAGGAFANLAGIANDRGKGIFDRQRKFRSENMKKKRADIASGKAFRGGQAGDKGFRGRVSTLGQNAYMRKNAASQGGLSKLFSESARDAQKQSAELHEKDHATKDVTLMTKLKNDDFAAILSLDSEAERIDYLVGKGYSRDSAQKEAQLATAMRREHGVDTANLLAVSAKAGSKTSYTGGIDEMLEDIIRASHGDEGMAMTLLGEASGAAMAAGRFDLGGGSFGEKAAMLKAKMYGKDVEYTDEATGERSVVAGNSTGAQINARQASKALDGLTTWELSRMHPTAAKNVAQSISADFQQAAQNVETNRANRARLQIAPPNETDDQRLARTTKMRELDDELPQLQRALGQKTAHIKTLESGLSQLPPEVARIMSSGLQDESNPIMIGNTRVASPSEAVRMMERADTELRSRGVPDNQIPPEVAGYRDLTRSPYGDTSGLTPAQREELMNRQKQS